MASITVQNVLQIISDLRGESTVNTNASRIRAVSRAEQDFAKRKFFRMHHVKNQSIGTGDGDTQDFEIGDDTYPMRMKGLTEVFVGGYNESNRFEAVDFGEFKRRYNANNGRRLVYEFFDPTDEIWKVHISPTPSDDEEITASWYYIPAEKTAVTDTIICNDPYIIAYSALADIYHGEDELQKEQLARQEAENRIGEAVGMEEAPAPGQLYVVPNIEPRAIGDY